MPGAREQELEALAQELIALADEQSRLQARMRSLRTRASDREATVRIVPTSAAPHWSSALREIAREEDEVKRALERSRAVLQALDERLRSADETKAGAEELRRKLASDSLR